HGDRERKYRPRTMLDAQMSLPYCIAVALLNGGEVRIEDFTERSFDDPEVLRLADKVSAEGDAELDRVPFRPMSMPSIVTIETTDGRRFERRVDYQKGDPRNPFSDDDYVRKFRTCVAPLLGDAAAKALTERTLALDDLKDVRALARLTVR
ncbi:MAG: hypothetical protein ACREKH_16655, partial [Candidatus Rokuibacteriota bacterium]